MPESPASSPRPFDFADLGRPRPASVRALPPAGAPPAPPSVDELSADDILESDDIDALEAAAAGIRSFETPAPSVPQVEAQPAPVEVAAVPVAETSGFEVGEIGAFDEVEVEGVVLRPTQPSPEPAPNAVIKPNPTLESPKAEPVPVPAPAVEAAPISIRVQYTSPAPSTLMGMPAAPITSPLPLESIIVDDAFPEKTLEIRRNDVAKVAAAAAQLDAPEQTEVLSRSAMPAALQAPQANGWQPITTRTPAPAPVQAHAHAHARRPGSIAPVALDVGTPLPAPRPQMGSAPAYAAYVPPRKSGMSGAAIGGIIFAAVALVGLVGVGGFAASRALSESGESASAAPAEVSAGNQAAAAATGQGSPASESAGSNAPVDPASAIDVSSLPSAPSRGARGITGSASNGGGGGVASGPALAAPGAAPAARTTTTLAPPGPVPTQGSAGGRTTALPPPGAPAAPAGALALPPPASTVAAAAPAPASASGTGVVHVDPNLRAVIVDGSYRRANDGAVTLSCGTHRIKAGMKEVQVVNVPCGGAVSL